MFHRIGDYLFIYLTARESIHTSRERWDELGERETTSRRLPPEHGAQCGHSIPCPWESWPEWKPKVQCLTKWAPQVPQGKLLRNYYEWLILDQLVLKDTLWDKQDYMWRPSWSEDPCLTLVFLNFIPNLWTREKKYSFSCMVFHNRTIRFKLLTERIW